jgi:hypothetical protein
MTRSESIIIGAILTDFALNYRLIRRVPPIYEVAPSITEPGSERLHGQKSMGLINTRLTVSLGPEGYN